MTDPTIGVIDSSQRAEIIFGEGRSFFYPGLLVL